MNRICLVGRLCADPILRYVSSGTPVTRFTLAVDRGRKNQQGEKETDFIRCSTWNKQAELVANYLQKGRLIAVEGRLKIDDVEQEGQHRQYVEVVCDRFSFLDKEKSRVSDTNGGVDGEYAKFGTEVDPHDDDVPF